MKPPNFAIILGLLGLFLSAPCAGDEDASLALLSPTEATAAGAGSYDLESNFCWLLAHSAARVGNSIIFDGGMAKYKVTVNGIDYGVPDLNGYTMSLDLSKDFRLDDLNSRLTILAKKAGADAQWKDGYSVNRGGMWTDGKDVWLQGGHFYTFVRYDNSTWHVDKAQIPAYEIWKYSQGKGWQKEKFTVEFGRDIRRTVSGASACTSETCYWFGGYISSRTTPEGSLTGGFSWAQRGMLAFELGNKTLRNETIDGYGTEDEGFAYGTLHHLPSKDPQGKGVLISLMAEKHAVSQPNTTADAWEAQGVPLNYVMIYDIENRRWHNQSTKAWEEDVSPPRTRFCGAMVYDEANRNWDLWIVGGQLVDDPNKGVDDIYVLTMPAFQWVKVEIKLPSRSWIRSHFCHPVGNQLLILGGGFPGTDVDQLTSCSPRLLNVLDMNNPGAFLSSYSASPPSYSQPATVRTQSGTAREPKAGWANARVKELMDGTFPVATTGAPKSGATKSSKLAAGPIAGIAVGAVAAIIIVVLLIIYFKRRRAVEDQSGGALVQKAPSVQEVEGRAVLHAQNSFQRCDPGPAPPIPPRL